MIGACLHPCPILLRPENRICSIIHDPHCGSYSAIPLQAFDIYYVQTLKVKCALNAKCFSNPDFAACSLNVVPGSAQAYRLDLSQSGILT